MFPRLPLLSPCCALPPHEQHQHLGEKHQPTPQRVAAPISDRVLCRPDGVREHKRNTTQRQAVYNEWVGAHLKRNGNLGTDERGKVAERAVHCDSGRGAAGVCVNDIGERARVYTPRPQCKHQRRTVT